jgi:protein-tyrosine phosphatase
MKGVTVRPTLFVVARPGPGRLATMARPRSGDWLADELKGLASSGVDVLVSLLSDPEIAELGLEQEGSLARAVGIDFHRLPTPDREVPDRAATIHLAETLAQRLVDGAGVAVHCRHGIGRASTLVAAVLVQEGVEPEDAWARIATARGLPVPDTDAQRHFITALAQHA